MLLCQSVLVLSRHIIPRNLPKVKSELGLGRYLWYTSHMKQLSVSMPYNPQISVNHAYRRGSPRYGKKKVVTEWLADFRLLVQNQLALLDCREVPEKVRMDIEVLCRPRRGRRPDSSNFRKLAQDVLAAALGVDDSIFSGTDHAAVRSDDPRIVFTVRLSP